MTVKMKQRINLVIAPSSKDFWTFIENKNKPLSQVNRTKLEVTIGDTLYRYISHPDKMRGYHGVEVSFTGNINLATIP